MTCIWRRCVFFICRLEKDSKEEYDWFFQLQATELLVPKDTPIWMTAAEFSPCEKLKLCRWVLKAWWNHHDWEIYLRHIWNWKLRPCRGRNGLLTQNPTYVFNNTGSGQQAHLSLLRSRRLWTLKHFAGISILSKFSSSQWPLVWIMFHFRQ